MKEDIIQAAKKSCHGIYLLINMRAKSAVMSSKSSNRSAAEILSPCVLYVGKLKNSKKRAVSHVNAAVKPPTQKNSRTVRRIRKLLKRGVNIGVVMIQLCNSEISFGVESQLIHDLKHLSNQNKGYQHLKFPKNKISHLTSLCLTYVFSRLNAGLYDHIQKTR